MPATSIGFPSDAATVDAVVRNARQEPLAGISVVLVPNALRERFDLYRSGITDAEGNVHTEGVIPGNYKAFAWENAEDGIWTDPEFIRAYESLVRETLLHDFDRDRV